MPEDQGMSSVGEPCACELCRFPSPRAQPGSLAEQARTQVRRALSETGTTQADLARRLGLSKKHVNQVLLGNTALSLDLAGRMLTALGWVAEFNARPCRTEEMKIAMLRDCSPDDGMPRSPWNKPLL